MKSRYTASKEQPIQNLRVQLDQLVYVEGTVSDEHLNKFNTLLAQLAIKDVAIDDTVKFYMLISILPEALSVISTAGSASEKMPVE